MAQKKKKGKPPKTEKPRRKMTTGQVVFAAIGVLVVLSMLLSMIRF